jgi:hypothetical protein
MLWEDLVLNSPPTAGDADLLCSALLVVEEHGIGAYNYSELAIPLVECKEQINHALSYAGQKACEEVDLAVKSESDSLALL